jgi:predicted neutral ceramidase superfamily lipid hydrolase
LTLFNRSKSIKIKTTTSMAKKSLDYKNAKKIILERRENNISDQEIYNELTQLFFDKKGVAYLIKGTLTKEIKEKYKIYNNILLALIGLSILMRFLTIFLLTNDSLNIMILTFLIMVPLLSIYFIYGIAKYYVTIYRFCGLLTFGGIIMSINHFDNLTNFLINLIFSLAVVALSFFMDSKMSPFYRSKYFKKDSQGEYILS